MVNRPTRGPDLPPERAGLHLRDQFLVKLPASLAPRFVDPDAPRGPGVTVAAAVAIEVTAAAFTEAIDEAVESAVVDVHWRAAWSEQPASLGQAVEELQLAPARRIRTQEVTRE